MEALDGLRVLDVSQYFTGPLCTAALADLGAEVISVEPLQGQAQRLVPPFLKNESYMFMMVNRNKKGVTLNLKTEKGKEIFKQLAAKSDVVVSNFTPGVMENLGLDYKELVKVNPRVIYASVAGFGQTGPYRTRPAYDFIAQAMTGFMCMTGFADTPVRSQVSVADHTASLYLAIAILTALQYRAKTGEGQEIDISMQDCLLAITSYEGFPIYFAEGKVPPRVGNRSPHAAPWNSYPALDGTVVITTASDPQWLALLKAIDREDLIDEARFETLAKRAENVDEVDAIIKEWTTARTVDEIIAKLLEAHVPCAPILDISETVNDPQIFARNMIAELHHPVAGSITTCGSPLKLSRTPGRIKSPPPLLGQHNEEVYSGLLGISKEQIMELREQGVV